MMMYDLIVVGGGPAGLTAALYARRANKSVLVIEKDSFGGQITMSPKVENIPGFAAISGNGFAEKLVEQVLEQGADMESAEVLSITDGAVKTVVTDFDTYQCKAVVLATGAKHRLLGVEGEERFLGEGISFCAVCDGAFYRDRTVAVIGGGNSALQEALLLSELAKKVFVIQNLDFFTGEQQLTEQLRQKPNVEIWMGHTVKAFCGNNALEGVEIERVVGGERRVLSVDGVFVAIGLIPQNEAFASLLTLDERGYADANEQCNTRTPGIFVAGDCRKKQIRQVATAVSDGAIAALAACDYMDATK